MLRGQACPSTVRRIDADGAAPPAYRDHADPRQSGRSPSRRVSCRTTASGWRAWSSSSPSTSRRIRMALLHPERIEDASERQAARSISLAVSAARRITSCSAWPKASGRSPLRSIRSRSSCECRTSRPTSTPACSGGAGLSRRKRIRCSASAGASRYAHPAYAEGFALGVRGDEARHARAWASRNIKLMIPFCRRVEEGAAGGCSACASSAWSVARTAWRSTSCARSRTTSLLIDEFSRIFDGFSIGSNDLTQLTLGVDRDSAIVAFDFDERDPGVKKMTAPRASRAAAQPPSFRHLRTGALRLSGVRGVPRTPRHRLDQLESRYRIQNYPAHPRARSAARTRAAGRILILGTSADAVGCPAG